MRPSLLPVLATTLSGLLVLACQNEELAVDVPSWPEAQTTNGPTSLTSHPGESAPAVPSVKTDLESTEADALCYARGRMVTEGTFAAADSFSVVGALGVTARVEGGNLLLDFQWPDELDSSTHRDWVSTLTLEGGALLEARAVKLPVWDEGVASRTCSAEAIVRRSGARRLLASDAELSIDVWDDHAVYGRVKVNGAELSFSAPFVPSVIADETTCCLKIRPQFPLPGPSLSAEEAKAVCAARDATPPIGTLTVDPAFSLVAGAVDVMVYETAHPFRHQLRVHMPYPRAKGKDADGAPTETESWFDWYFSETSDTPLPARFGPGRYENANGFGASGGSMCAANRGGGGSSTIQFSNLALVIDRREGDRIEGAIETIDSTGEVRRAKFATVVNPPPRLSICCLE